MAPVIFGFCFFGTARLASLALIVTSGVWLPRSKYFDMPKKAAPKRAAAAAAAPTAAGKRVAPKRAAEQPVAQPLSKRAAKGKGKAAVGEDKAPVVPTKVQGTPTAEANMDESVEEVPEPTAHETTTPSPTMNMITMFWQQLLAKSPDDPTLDLGVELLLRSMLLAEDGHGLDASLVFLEAIQAQESMKAQHATADVLHTTLMGVIQALRTAAQTGRPFSYPVSRPSPAAPTATTAVTTAAPKAPVAAATTATATPPGSANVIPTAVAANVTQLITSMTNRFDNILGTKSAYSDKVTLLSVLQLLLGNPHAPGFDPANLCDMGQNLSADPTFPVQLLMHDMSALTVPTADLLAAHSASGSAQALAAPPAQLYGMLSRLRAATLKAAEAAPALTADKVQHRLLQVAGPSGIMAKVVIALGSTHSAVRGLQAAGNAYTQIAQFIDDAKNIDANETQLLALLGYMLRQVHQQGDRIAWGPAHLKGTSDVATKAQAQSLLWQARHLEAAVARRPRRARPPRPPRPGQLPRHCAPPCRRRAPPRRIRRRPLCEARPAGRRRAPLPQRQPKPCVRVAR